jgi:hypothetical protein
LTLSKRPRRSKVPKKITEVVEVLITPNGTEDSSVEAYEPMGQILVDLFNIAKQAEKQSKKSNSIEIRKWYDYAEAFENRVRELISEGVKDRAARTQIYNTMLPYMSRQMTIGNLRQITHKARNIFNIFSEVGVGAIDQAGCFTANHLSEYSNDDIKRIVEHVKRRRVS